MSVYMVRGTKAPFQQNISFAVANYLSDDVKSEIRAVLDDDPGYDWSALREALTVETCSAWGTTTGYANVYEDVEPGDWIIYWDGSSDTMRYYQEVGTLVGADAPMDARQQISRLIWRDQGYEFLWFATQPVIEDTRTVAEFEDLISEVRADFGLREDWFPGQAGNFRQIPEDVVQHFGGTDEFLQRLQTEAANEREPAPARYFLLSEELLVDEDRERVYAAYDATYSMANDDFEEVLAASDTDLSPDPRVKYIDIPRRDSGNLPEAANDGVALIHNGEEIVARGRFGNREGKQIKSRIHDLITLFDYRELDPIPLSGTGSLSGDIRTPFQEITADQYGRLIDRSPAMAENTTRAVHGWDPTTEEEYRAQWLADRYHEAPGWEERKTVVDQTAAAVRTLANALIQERDRLTTADLTTLFRLCQHSDQILVSTKESAVRDLDLPAEKESKILDLITEDIGTIGGPNFSQELSTPQAEEAAYTLIETIVESSDRESRDGAIAEFAEFDIEGLQAGSISPILHYFRPTQFPIINSKVIEGMSKYFNESLDPSLETYLSACETLRTVRDRYGFRRLFRDLDYFFIWADKEVPQWEHDWTWMLDDDGDSMRNIYAIQPGESGQDGRPDERPALWEVWQDNSIVSVGGDPGDLRAVSTEKRREKGDAADWGAKQAWDLFVEMSPGDIVISKWGQQAFTGIGVVQSNSYRYEPDGVGYQQITAEHESGHPHLRDVEWIWTVEAPLAVDEVGLSAQFDQDTLYEYSYFEEFRYKLAPVIDDDIKVFADLEAESHRLTGLGQTTFDGTVPSESRPDIIDAEFQTGALDEAALFDGLYYPDAERTQLTNQITAALRAGKHIVFTGPPGTGKTELAENVSRLLVNADESPFTGYNLTTATADWTTFDTVGGRMPEGNSDKLVFIPGIILEQFKQNGQQQNTLLIIDELNRADIDAAFGQLFTVLSGQGVQLPFQRGDEPVEIIPADEFDGTQPAAHEYVVPNSWRLCATMNSYDKTSLYEMSYAFMRRLAFISVGVPDLDAHAATDQPLLFILPYLELWFDGGDPDEPLDRDQLDNDDALPDPIDVEGVVAVWESLTTGEHTRPIGPAIVRDMLEYMMHHEGNPEERLADALESYVLSQLEGVPDADEIVDELCSLDQIGSESDALERTAETMLNIRLGNDDESAFGT